LFHVLHYHSDEKTSLSTNFLLSVVSRDVAQWLHLLLHCMIRAIWLLIILQSSVDLVFNVQDLGLYFANKKALRARLSFYDFRAICVSLVRCKHIQVLSSIFIF
jgi:hypothetical protein